MLSMSDGVSAGQCTNYHDTPDYYTQHGGEWLGSLAEDLGLKGHVDKADFRAIAAGLDPRDPSKVLVHGKTAAGVEKRRAGNDLTFSASKSVSIMYAAGDESMRDIHNDAVRAVMDYIEQYHSTYRPADGHGGNIREHTGNILAAKFDHATSRECDPDLHSHVVLMNMTKDKNGNWKANDPKEIYPIKKELGRLYRNEMIKGLRKAGRGVEITDGNELYYEVKGVEKDLIHNLSTRKNDIDKQVDEWEKSGKYDGKSKSEIRDLAAAAKRKGKVKSTEAETKSTFDRKFAENGTNRAQILAGAERESVRVNEIPLPSNQVAAQRAEKVQAVDVSIRQAIDTLHETQSVFTRGQVLDVANKLDAGKHNLPDLVKGWNDLLEQSDVTALGQSRSQDIFSSKEMIALEQGNLDRIKGYEGTFKAQTTEKEILAWLPGWEKLNKFPLSEGQLDAMIKELCSSNGLLNIQGDPGTGKTTLRKAIEAFSREVLAPSGRGHYVLGAGYTGTAAKELGGAMERTANTIEKFLGMHVVAVDPAKYAQIVAIQQEALKAKYQEPPAAGGEKAKVVSKSKQGTLTGGSIVTEKMSDDTTRKSQLMIIGGIRTGVTDMYNKEGKLTGTRKTNISTGDSRFFGADGKLKSTTSRQGLLGGDNKATTVYEDGRVKDTHTMFTAGIKKEHVEWTMQDGSKSKDGKFRDEDGKVLTSSNIKFVPKGSNIAMVIDEYSFVGSKQDRLLHEKAQKLFEQLGVSIKFVRMGDTKQYSAINAGKPFENSIDHSKADLVRLKEVNRQVNAALLDVVKQFNVDDKSLRGAAAQEGFDQLKGMGFVFECKEVGKLADTAIALRSKLGEQLTTYTDVKGIERKVFLKDAPIMTGTNKVCDQINQKVRADLQAKGELKDERTFTALKPSGLSAVQMGVASNYKVGDTISFNGYRDKKGKKQQYSDITNGSSAVITGSDSTKNTVTVAGREIKVTDLMDKVSISKAETKKFAVGDNIICLQNDTKRGITNGTQLKVIGFDKESGGVIAQYHDKAKGKKAPEIVNLSGYQQIDHAYAITPQKAQGATMAASIHCHMPQDKLSHNGVNVITSRGKEASFIVTSDAEKYRQQVGQLGGQVDTVEKSGRRRIDSALSKDASAAVDKSFADQQRGVKVPGGKSAPRQSLSVEQLQEKQQIAKEQNGIRQMLKAGDENKRESYTTNKAIGDGEKPNAEKKAEMRAEMQEMTLKEKIVRIGEVDSQIKNPDTPKNKLWVEHDLLKEAILADMKSGPKTAPQVAQEQAIITAARPEVAQQTGVAQNPSKKQKADLVNKIGEVIEMPSSKPVLDGESVMPVEGSDKNRRADKSRDFSK